MVLGVIELLLVLLLLGGLTVLVVSAVSAANRPPAPPAPPALPAPDPALVRVRDLAWDHRDIETPLADALIGYLNEHEADADQRAVRNQVGEIAWAHREDCPGLSVLVIDALRRRDS